MTTLRLPLLEPHRSSLEKCVYCPKLSRAACPVSTVEASESVTPWGKMSMAYFVARGDVPIDPEHAAPAWACTGCYACRERCDHHNEVATVLFDARAELFARGAAPDGARDVVASWSARAEELAARALGGDPPAGATPVLVGCGYVRRSPEVARDALAAAAALVGGPVRAVQSCCGLPLLEAGDRPAFVAAAQRLLAEIAGQRRLVVVDPGCARTLLVEYDRVGVQTELAAGRARAPRPELLVDLAFAALERIGPLPDLAGATVRYHDPCQLGRGLGRYDEPRAVLARLAGAAPADFPRSRAHAECTGGGGLLPVTRPESSRAIADERIAEHRALGGGVLVTACGQSLHRLRTRGEPAVDLVSLLRRALAPAAQGT